MDLPTMGDINTALAHLGNWRVLHAQEACYPYRPIPASIMLALGFRESGLRNVCGGARLEKGVWVQSYTDRGWLQISDQIDREREWLAKQEGCGNGYWTPTTPATTALQSMHVPRFSPALEFTKQTMLADMRFATANGVPSSNLLRFAVAAHNAGPTGALNGWQQGDIDKYTAHGDYSAYVADVAPLIHAWIVEHPHWQYQP